jgi:hypothetical protein
MESKFGSLRLVVSHGPINQDQEARLYRHIVFSSVYVYGQR